MRKLIRGTILTLLALLGITYVYHKKQTWNTKEYAITDVIDNRYVVLRKWEHDNHFVYHVYDTVSGNETSVRRKKYVQLR